MKMTLLLCGGWIFLSLSYTHHSRNTVCIFYFQLLVLNIHPKHNKRRQKTVTRRPEKPLNSITLIKGPNPRGQNPGRSSSSHPAVVLRWAFLHITPASISLLQLTGYTIRGDPNAVFTIGRSFITISSAEKKSVLWWDEVLNAIGASWYHTISMQYKQT